MIISEYYDEAYDIRVDNQKVAHFCANGIWTAAKLPSGKHILTIRRSQKIFWPLATLIVGVAVLLWGGMRLLRRGNSEIEAITPENSDT